MEIGFEAKRFFTNITGLGNYSRFIAGALSYYFPQHHYYLYTPRKVCNHETLNIIDRPNITVVEPSSWYKFSHTTSLWRTWGVTREPTVKKLNLFHGLSQELPVNLSKKIKKVVSVHDLIFYRYPKFYNPIDVAIYKQKLTFSCKEADRIIAISNQTKQDLCDFLNVDSSKIEVIYQGCHPNFKNKFSSVAIDQIKTKYKLPHNYILSVGTIEERKNVILLLKALALLPQSLRIPVVILGRPTKYLREVLNTAKQLNVLNDLIFLQNVSFAEFPAIYQGAQLFVYPSLFEGFGIPLIEAIESRVPVITSLGSCFSEAAGPHSIYVSPHNGEELAVQIGRVLSDSNLREAMVSGSYAYIQQFEPKIIADKIMGVYAQ